LSRDITLENKYLKYVITSDGFNKSFIDKLTGKNYIAHDLPNFFMSIVKDGERYLSSLVEFDGEKMTVFFEPSGITISLNVRMLEDYMTFEVSSISDEDLDEVTLANLNLSIRENIGRLLNIGWNDEFAACVLALNLQTRSYGRSDEYASLAAKCYSRYGLKGSKIAVIGVPSGIIKKTIRKVQLNEGLPSPTLASVWDKESLEVKKSYLFLTLSEENVDEAIKYAKEGGFGYILDMWPTQSLGHYLLNRKNYPHGLYGMKRVVKKIHEAGLKAGLHFMTTCISKDDPYVTPVPDRRLAKDGCFILADRIDEKSTFIPTEKPPRGVPTKPGGYYIGGGTDIQIDDEIITYKGVSSKPPYGFTGCIRGARGTKPARHEKGAAIHHLAEMFGWYIADADTTLLDEIAQRIADIVNECEYDMVYFDGAEAASLQGAWWYYIPKVQLAFYNKFKREVLIEGASYTVSIYKGQGTMLETSSEQLDHFNWHIYSRDAQTDFVSRGVKGHIDKVKIKGVIDTCKNLMPAEFGWFGYFTKTPFHDATQPDEVEYVCNKCLGYDVPFSLETSIETLRNNGWTPQILSILRNYEMLRLKNYFSEEEKAKLRKPGAEFRLKFSGGKWRLIPVKHFEYYVRSIDGVNNVWKIYNEFKSPSIELRIQSLPSPADYDDPENITLVDFEESKPFDVSSSKNGVSCKIEVSKEKVKARNCSGKITAESSLKDDSGWCQFEKQVSLDLSSNRGIGFWIYGDGKGEILNVQLKNPSGEVQWICDHYVVIDFKGWRYQELPEPEGERIFEFFKHTKDYYITAARAFDYSRVNFVNLRLMKLPPNQKVTLYLSNVKALREKPLPLKNPNLTIEGKTIKFSAELQPDQYLIFKPEEDTCGVYSANGFLLKDVKVEGETPEVKTGTNRITFNCDYSKGFSEKAKVRLTLLGEK